MIIYEEYLTILLHSQLKKLEKKTYFKDPIGILTLNLCELLNFVM